MMGTAHTTLQRFVVRMLFDPQFVDRVHQEDQIPGLDDEALAWLRAVPRQAWSTDPYRRSRSLQALLEEFPVSAAIWTAEVGDLRKLDAFFSSNAFHVCIHERGSLALSFGNWLEATTGPIGTLETAFARARRFKPPQGQGWVLAPGHEPVALPVGTVRRYLAIREYLGGDAIGKLLEGLSLPSNLPPLGEQTEHLLIEGGATSDLSIGHIGQALYDLLNGARHAKTIVQLQQLAISLGAEPDEAGTVVQDLIDEELILEIAS